MRINAISTLNASVSSISVSKTINDKKQNPISTKDCEVKATSNPIFATYITNSPISKQVNFRGKVVHILDGGIHATNMKYFAKYVKGDLNIQMHELQINAKDRFTKQLDSLERQLKQLNKRENIAGEYVAIPNLFFPFGIWNNVNFDFVGVGAA